MSTPPVKGGREGLALGRRSSPALKELTIELGEADVYVNMARRIDLDNGHVLYEAVLTDPHGSRAIYIDREDIVECLRDMFLPAGAPVAPPSDADRSPRSRT